MTMLPFSYTLIVVLLGTVILGGIAGMIGTLVVFRSQALIGDALSHATLPGVVIAFMLMQARQLEVLLVGAFISAVIAMFLLDVIKHHTTIKFDASMALILSAFFGFGQVLLSHIHKDGSAAQAGLSRFIFGQAATLLRSDVYLLAGVALLLFVLLMLFFKELKLFIFDEPFFVSLGFSRRIMNALITFMVVMIITIGIRMVGVILMSALLIAPAVAARQFSNRFGINVFLAWLIGGIGGAVGTYMSAARANMPTGPVIVLVLGVIVLFSVLFSFNDGLIKHAFLNWRYRIQIQKYRALIHFYENPDKAPMAEDDYAYFINHDYLRHTNGDLNLTKKGLKKVRLIKGVVDNEY